MKAALRQAQGPLYRQAQGPLSNNRNIHTCVRSLSLSKGAHKMIIKHSTPLSKLRSSELRMFLRKSG